MTWAVNWKEQEAELLLLEMILPRRDKINEHLEDAGSGVNIRAPWIDSLSYWSVPLFLCNPKGYISSTAAPKKKKEKRKIINGIY